MSSPRLGSNMVLASLLAVLSYVPFEWVAKGSLLVCALLFVLDPIPPITRLISIVSLAVVYKITQLYNQHRLEQEQESEIVIESTIRPTSGERNEEQSQVSPRTHTNGTKQD